MAYSSPKSGTDYFLYPSLVKGSFMVQLTRIYTKSGDKGKTSLGTGKRVAKHDLRIEVIGAVDEINASLGIAILDLDQDLKKILTRVQNDLFDLGADLCMPEGDGLRIIESQVTWLEKEIDRLNEALLPLTSFILPGGSRASSYLHLARTITRRAERLCSKLLEKEPSLNIFIFQYLNRLSDLLFVMGRYGNNHGKDDVLWIPGAHRS